MNSKERNQTSIFIMSVMLVFIFQQMASKIGGVSANLFDYSSIDKDNTFLWITVHHAVQMVLAIIAIFIIHKKLSLNFGLKIRVDKTGIKYIVIFSFAIIGYVMISYLVSYAGHRIASYSYELNARNVIGTLGFQLLLSGTSEELLFRALPITVFKYTLGGSKKQCIAIILITSALFSIAHINWSIMPFALSFDWFQLVYSFVLGIIYGVTFEKTKSVIYPMIMHSLSNVFMVGFGYAFAYIVK